MSISCAHKFENSGSMSPCPSAQLSSMSISLSSMTLFPFWSFFIKSTFCFGSVLKKSLTTQTLGVLTHNTEEKERAK